VFEKPGIFALRVFYRGKLQRMWITSSQLEGAVTLLKEDIGACTSIIGRRRVFLAWVALFFALLR
jgi:hypothetical protein